MKDLYDLYNDPLEQRPGWVEGGILPKGSFCLFGGLSGIGKSLLTLNMIRNLVEGENFLGTTYRCLEVPQSILYIDGECGEHTTTERVKRVFAGAQNMQPRKVWVRSFPEFYLDLPNERERFWQLIRDVPKLPDIVILDPIGDFINGSDSDNPTIRQVYSTLTRTQEKLGKDMTFIMSHHFRKRPSGQGMQFHDPLDPYEFRGASQWVNKCWTALTLDRASPDDGEGWDLRGRFAKVRAGETPGTDLHLRITKENFRVSRRLPHDSPWA